MVVLALLLSGCGSTAGPATTPTPKMATPSATPSAIVSASTVLSPVGRWATSMAYDQAAHAAVLFGGTAGGALLGDTWTWDGTRWLERSGLTGSPSARLGAAMAYDDQTGQVILFGGQGPSSNALDDTWAWDGSAWHQLQPSHSPSPREGASAVYDPALSV